MEDSNSVVFWVRRGIASRADKQMEAKADFCKELHCAARIHDSVSGKWRVVPRRDWGCCGSCIEIMLLPLFAPSSVLSLEQQFVSLLVHEVSLGPT